MKYLIVAITIEVYKVFLKSRDHLHHSYNNRICLYLKYSPQYFQFYRRGLVFQMKKWVSEGGSEGNMSSTPDIFSEKCFSKICSKVKREYQFQVAISIKLESNFIKVRLQHGCCAVNLLHISRGTFPKNTFGRLLLRQ